ncbi:MAG: hypothetical protein AB1714_20090 [Acidobacteriota bacterium]
MNSYLLILFVFSVLVTAVLTPLQKEGKREQIVYAIKLFCGLFFGAILAGWLMYPFPF